MLPVCTPSKYPRVHEALHQATLLWTFPRLQKLLPAENVFRRHRGITRGAIALIATEQFEAAIHEPEQSLTMYMVVETRAGASRIDTGFHGVLSF